MMAVHRHDHPLSVTSSTLFIILCLWCHAKPTMGLCLHPTTSYSRESIRVLRRSQDAGRNTMELLAHSRLDLPSNNHTAGFFQRLGGAIGRSSTRSAALQDFLVALRQRTQNMLKISHTLPSLLRRAGKDNSVDQTAVTMDSDESIALAAFENPTGPRWAIADHGIDLSGEWVPIVTPEFKKAYDTYLAKCGQSFLYRKIVVNALSLQREFIRQLNGGRQLELVATNPAGNWNRTLVASGADIGFHQFQPLNVTLVDPDGDMVQVEAWWDKAGKVHRSWLLGKPKVQGGQFETTRYLEGDDVLICESAFHPNKWGAESSRFRSAHVVWRYRRAS